MVGWGRVSPRGSVGIPDLLPYKIGTGGTDETRGDRVPYSLDYQVEVGRCLLSRHKGQFYRTAPY